LTSPLLEFYNAVFSIPILDVLGEDELGNPIALEGLATNYKAYLKKPKRDPNVNYSAGVDSTKSYFEGYLVGPESLPTGLLLPATFDCCKRRGAGDLWDQGTFEILPVYNPIPLVEETLGQAVAGYFWRTN
jgi:hypothetical protein